MTPEELERRLFQRWEAEELTIDQFVAGLQAHGWKRDEAYDWLCGVKRPGHRRPLTSHAR